jgi:hypothetical protein
MSNKEEAAAHLMKRMAAVLVFLSLCNISAIGLSLSPPQLTDEFIAGTVGAIIGGINAVYPDLITSPGELPEKICARQEQSTVNTESDMVTSIITQSVIRKKYRLGISVGSALAVGYVRLSHKKGFEDPLGRVVLINIGVSVGLVVACRPLQWMEPFESSMLVKTLKVVWVIGFPALLTGWFASVGLN